MSGREVSWVLDHSPYRGATLMVHLVVADAANDLNAYELWARQSVIGKKARVSRQAVNAAMESLVADGFLVVLEDNQKAGKANRYRFLKPDVAVVWDPPMPSGGVNRDDTPVSTGTTRGVNRDDTGVSTGVTPGVVPVDTEQVSEHGSRSLKGTGRPEPASPPRSWPPAARKIAEHLATKRRENGCAPQQVTDAWFDAARLLVEKDGRGEQEVHAVIEWVSRHKRFWAGRIKTPRHLREHYDEIRLQMESDKRTSAARGTISPHILAFAEQVAAEEDEMASNGQGAFA